jgi:hypothetical protein
LASVIIFALVLNRITADRQQGRESRRVALQQHLIAGRKALLESDFATALQEFNLAQAMQASEAGHLSASEHQELRQLQRQAALLKDWAGEPLDFILARSAQLKNEEWQAVVGQYRGKAFIFDAELRLDAGRQYQAKINRAGRGPLLKLELQDLKLLGYLPLDEPKRVLFGARLVEIRREAEGTCVVRLVPDSGVLLTDVASAGLGQMIADPLLQQILQQQREWAANLP